MSKFKIHKIEVEGFYDTRRVTPWDYDETIEQFASEHQIILPKWEALRKIGDTKALWILLSPHLTITATDKRGNWRQWRFDRGFIWDQASVPLFKNNLLEAIIPAMPHDGSFSLHTWYDFSETNRMFYQMILAFKMKPVLAAIYYMSVNSMFGRGRWETNPRGFWHKKTAHYMEGRACNTLKAHY